jgi:integrase
MSAQAVRRLSKPGIHAVGGVSGLVLQVGRGRDAEGKPTGDASDSRCWLLRTHIGKKRRSIGLGPFPEVSLAQARDKARDMKAQIREGVDPLAERRAKQAALIEARARALTFEQAARATFATKESKFKNKRSRDRWLGILEKYAFPIIGNMEVADVDLPHLQKVLEPIWTTKHETAARVRAHTEQVLTWATVSKYRHGDNPARWAGNLAVVMPDVQKKVTHHRALPWSRVPEFMERLRQRGGMAARALEFAILTAGRSGEIRHATWDEIDLAGKVWTIPAERMKMDKAHVVPLSDEAIALLKALPRLHESELVFPNAAGNALSDAMLSKLTRSMGGECVPHGFRSSFKDWARHNSSAPDEVSELALAHVDTNAARAAYARDGLLPQRARMMKHWTTFCREGLPESADVIDIGGER